MSKFEEKAMEILDEYVNQANRYPEPEEFAHILSIRLNRPVSRTEAKRLIELHYKRWLLKKAEEEVGRYDFNKFYEAMVNVVKCTDAMFRETKEIKWGIRASILSFIFDRLKNVLVKEGLVDKVETEAIEDEYMEFLRNPQPFSKICTVEGYDDDMEEVQTGINMLTEYFRGMGEIIAAFLVNTTYFEVVSVFREIRKDIYKVG
ncbi:hypothetical protein DRP04_01720 [Archaeoglobales archaeon]|nr:MAG: hypothetical protein DRP04_01720 [Archaeoglobales archaeon]